MRYQGRRKKTDKKKKDFLNFRYFSIIFREKPLDNWKTNAIFATSITNPKTS